jgi:hypothetical protein
MNSNNEILTEAYFNKLKNKYFGLLCEKEKGRDWEKFLDSIIIELYGFSEEERSINWVELVNKTNSLRYLDYEYFRKTIFECMGLLSK